MKQKETNQKKAYISPSIRLTAIQTEHTILAASGDAAANFTANQPLHSEFEMHSFESSKLSALNTSNIQINE